MEHSDNLLRNAMVMAYQLASSSSHDKSTNNAAILVCPKSGDLIAGANQFPVGIDPRDPANHEKPLKYKLMVHAERMAIYGAAIRGYPTHGGTMICPWAACPECAQAIIESGIKRLGTHRDRLMETPERWRADVALGLKMLRDAEVEVVMLEGPVNAGVKILFDGKEIKV